LPPGASRVLTGAWQAGAVTTAVLDDSPGPGPSPAGTGQAPAAAGCLPPSVGAV